MAAFRTLPRSAPRAIRDTYIIILVLLWKKMTWFDRRDPFHPQASDAREPGDIDYSRVVHSAAFRRLQGKTQIYNLGDSDFYRTRLTHTIEVAQIAAGLVRQLGHSFPEHPASSHLPGHTLIQAISSAHDLGHPPFGHGGEVALNYCMRFAGGFEGNGQTLRILSKLEHFSRNDGANLSRRALLGILKYPASYSTLHHSDVAPGLLEGTGSMEIIDVESSKPPKCYLDCDRDVVDWLLDPLSARDRDIFTSWLPTELHGKTQHKSLDCTLMDVADDIAYGVHDLEDALALRLVDRETFARYVTRNTCEAFMEERRRRYPTETNDYYTAMIEGLFGTAGNRKHWISRLVGFFITSVEYDQHSELEEPLLRWRVALPEGHRKFLTALKDFVSGEVIKTSRVQQLEFKGQMMVASVFKAFMSDPLRLFPGDSWDKTVSQDVVARNICDHIASMTDVHLQRTYERMFAPRMGSVFDDI